MAGYESIIYRLAEKIMDKLPNWMFTKEILVSSENELNIETVSSLTLHGVKISQVPQSEPVSNINIFEASGTNIEEIYNVVFPIVQKIVKEWVVPPIVGTTMSLFKIHMKEQIKQYKLSVYRWERVVVSNTNTKRAVLVNVSSSTKGFAISYVCRKNGLPLISSQHGVTLEISKEHGRIPITFNNTASDILLSYNSKIINLKKENKIFNKINKIIGKKKNTLLFGVTYKENVDDIRNSPALNIIKKIRKVNTKVNIFDPINDNFNNINIKDLREKKFDLLVVFVNHDWLKKNSINYKKKIIL